MSTNFQYAAKGFAIGVALGGTILVGVDMIPGVNIFGIGDGVEQSDRGSGRIVADTPRDEFPDGRRGHGEGVGSEGYPTTDDRGSGRVG